MTAVALWRPSLSTRPWSQMAGERFFRVCIEARFGARSDPSFQTRPIQGAIRLIATSAVATRPLDVAPAVRFAQILLKKCAAIRVSMPLAHLARTGFFKPVHVKSLSAHAVRSLIIARKKLVGQRVTLENQIRGLAVVFGIRLPRALTAAFIEQALKASEGVGGLSAAMRGLIAARTAVMIAVAAIDADIRRMTTASEACRRLMAIPGVGQLTALAFVAAIDDPSRIRRSRDVGAYLGLVPKRYQSGEVDYVGGISKCGDRRVRTLLYEAANVMLTRTRASSSSRTGPLRSPGDQACARRASLWRVASPSSCTPCCGTERRSSRRRPADH